jgi:hypothetical protein
MGGAWIAVDDDPEHTGLTYIDLFEYLGIDSPLRDYWYVDADRGIWVVYKWNGRKYTRPYPMPKDWKSKSDTL